MRVAALFVEAHGVYFGLPDVDPWDAARDARQYAGPHPVVAHPPCERWGRYWTGGPSAKERRRLGDDAGCFASALASVQAWGGGAGAPRGIARLPRERASAAALGRGVDDRGILAGLRVLRRAGQLRTSRSEAHLALRGGRRASRTGLVDPRAARAAGRGVSYGSRAPRGLRSAHCRAAPRRSPSAPRESRDPRSVPGRAVGHGAEQTVESCVM